MLAKVHSNSQLVAGQVDRCEGGDAAQGVWDASLQVTRGQEDL